MHILLIILTILLCLIGLLLSALAFSGTWLVLLAALITFFSAGVPSVTTLAAFLLICIAVEVIEALAGWLGVQKRGGSKLASAAAVAGGLLGALAGSAVFPVIGTLLGMLAGSFALAFLVESNRLKHHGQAAHIAWGTVWARLLILFVKLTLTLGMSIWLITLLLR
jgi:uncharacterized protein YqgC (DUF456 family)